MSAIQHIAGPFQDGIQKCIKCGRILADYTNTVYPAGQEAPKGFVEGAKIISEKHSWGEQFWVEEFVKAGAFSYVMECTSTIHIPDDGYGQSL